MKNLISALFLIAALSAEASDFPLLENFGALGIDSDSGIKGPAYAKIVEELSSLAAEYPEYAQLVQYGSSVEGRTLNLIKIKSRSVQSLTSKAIYIGGSIHGDEYLNIEDRLPRWFLTEGLQHLSIMRFLNDGGTIYIAPILNPDGYDRRARRNSNNVDLNRDYTVVAAGVKGFAQPETRFLRDYLMREMEQNQKLTVAMDYHCCIGALLYPWSFTGPKLPETSKAQHAQVGKIMQKNLGASMKYGTTPVILGYSAKGTSKDYYYESFGALGFTFEGRRNKENSYFAEHTAMWSEIIDFVNSGPGLQVKPDSL